MSECVSDRCETTLDKVHDGHRERDARAETEAESHRAIRINIGTKKPLHSLLFGIILAE